MSQNFKIAFALEESDIAYFRKIFRNARKSAADQDETSIIAAVQSLIDRVRKTKKTPSFVREAVQILEDLVHMLQDTDYELPKAPRAEMLGALAYFANPEDLIPDQVPGLGFLDDAIMIKLVEEELKHEIWGYRKFCKFRDGAEQRPWSMIAKERLPGRLKGRRDEIRAAIREREERDSAA